MTQATNDTADDLRRGILDTKIARPVAFVLVAAFLLGIYAIPIAQGVLDKIHDDEPVMLDLFRRVPTRASLRQLEDDLEKASTPREKVQPRVQAALTRFGGFGNTKAVLGTKPGWLFYQPGVAAVGGPGLLDAEVLATRRKVAADAGAPVEPDPRPAILAFHRFLLGRGVRLVLFPVPDKAGLQPAELHGRLGVARPAPPGANSDLPRLYDELRREGVLIFDPTPSAIDPAEPPRYLEQDTHWTPRFMMEVADRLGAFVRAEAKLGPPATARRWQLTPRTVSRVGDVVDMLGLGEEQTLFAPRPITVFEVRDGEGKAFEPAAGADVLLLGDSFTNVFSLGQMGWGEGAGLGPHLARALGRDVDVIAQNDAGAHATRRLLANDLERLGGKKVVIWELASRELAVGDWKPIAWPASGKASP